MVLTGKNVDLGMIDYSTEGIKKLPSATEVSKRSGYYCGKYRTGCRYAEMTW